MVRGGGKKKDSKKGKGRGGKKSTNGGKGRGGLKKRGVGKGKGEHCGKNGERRLRGGISR